MCKHLTWQRLLLLLPLPLLLPHVCHILATCATGVATSAPTSHPPASALSWPAFCLHAKLHCPLNWSLLMKIATVFPQFAEYPLPHRLLALHSIPLPPLSEQIFAVKRQTSLTDCLTNQICLELLYDHHHHHHYLCCYPIMLCLYFPGKWKKCEITQCRP